MAVLSYMIRRLFLLGVALACVIAMGSCDDDDSFSVSPTDILTFSTDTVSMDTVFSTVPTPTYSFWVYNYNNDGLRVSQVRLQRGNQTGFRVNVDGTYLDNTMGSLARDLEIRKGDSIRVFVELTSSRNNAGEPQLVQDNLVFTLESGVEQSVNLRAYSWDALLCNGVTISRDSIISTSTPIVVYDGLQVDSGVTLTISAPTKLYFHSGAGMDVYGTLIVSGQSGNEVTMRGDRTDRMFDYLPYDRVSGQWRGIRFHSSSTGNAIRFADIHSAEDAIVCDSAEYDSICPRLILENVTIHNNKGAGLLAYNSYLSMVNCQITNALGDCVAIYGGQAEIIYCTLAQFYPFDSDRGVALRFSNQYENAAYPLYRLVCYNTLVTGYAGDEIMGEAADSLSAFSYYFSHCILRTPAIEDSLQLEAFTNTIFETSTDTVQGTGHFCDIDTDNLYYDFHLDSLSTARGKAMALGMYMYDRDGNPRGETPDIGCYRYGAESGSTSVLQ